LRNFHTVLHRYWIILYSYQQCIKLLIFPHYCQHLSFIVVAYSIHSNRPKIILSLYFWFGFLLFNYDECIFIYLLVICMFFGQLSKSLCPFNFFVLSYRSLLYIFGNITTY
jgi:hypothetical protein